NNDKDIASMDKEYQALAQEIDHIADKTNFNGNAFLNKGTDGKDITIQLSDASSDTMTIAAIETKKLTTATLAVGTGKALDATTAA
ncbi:flagellin, partial [Bacillus cereus]